MKFVKYFLSVMLAVGTLGTIAGDFTLSEKNGSLTVDFRGKPLISSSEFVMDNAPLFPAGELNTEQKQLPDGSSAINVWSKDSKHRCRQEAVISADGNRVEISMQFDYQAYSAAADKVVSYRLNIPFAQLDGVKFDAVIGRSTKTSEVHSTFGNTFGNFTSDRPRMFAPQLASGSVLFDFDCRGVGAYTGVSLNTLIAQWQMLRTKDAPDVLRLNAAAKIPSYGGGLTAKLILTAGGLKEFRACHLRTKYSYYDALPAQKLYSFGAAKVGSQYTKLDLTAAQDGKDGWSDVGNAKAISGQADGAFYSAVAGQKDATLKIGNLPPGFYFVTVGVGNFDRAANHFAVTVNGETLAKDISVKPGDAASLTRVFKLEKGSAEIKFSGNWRISTLGFQQLISIYEDFSFERGFWVTQGFEPGVLFRSEDYAQPPKYATGRTDFRLPDPAKPQPKAKTMTYETAPLSAEAQKAMEWRYHAVLGSVGPGNNGTFHEFDAPGLVEKRMDFAQKDKLNVLINSGLLSRHTYPKHLALARTMLRRLTDAAHRRGIRMFDHIDYVLLWNMDSGYRVAAEHPEWLTRELTTLLPTTNFCTNNHDRNERFRKYFKQWIQDTGIDGMMIDEANFIGLNFCGCGDCRSDFTAETGCEWPASELAADQMTAKGTPAETPLAKLFRTWRTKHVGDWWIALRKTIQKDYPAFCFLCYTTHYGLTDGYTSNYLGSDLMQIGRTADFLGTEIMSRNVWASYRSVFAYRKAQNLFHIAFDCPIFGLVYAGNWDVAYAGWAINNMNGQITWADPMDCPAGKGNYYLFGDRNMDLSKAKNVADVAVLFSSQGRDNGVRMHYRPEMFGIAQMLGDMHVNYDIIGDTTLSDELLKPYRVLLVAASAPLSDAQVKTICDFAKRGGHVVLGAIAGLADQYGNVREKWAFADVFGFSLLKSSSKVPQLELDNGELLQPETPIMAILPDPYKHPWDKAPVMMAWGKNTRIPAIIEKQLGKGKMKFMPLTVASTVAEVECTPGRPYAFDPDPVNMRALEYILSAVLKDAKAGTWQCEAPRKVLATLYRQDNTYYAHFYNASGANLKKGDEVLYTTPANAFPTPETDITFTLPHPELTVAEAASPDFEGWKPLQLEKVDGGVKVTLPKNLLTVYTLVRVR